MLNANTRCRKAHRRHRTITARFVRIDQEGRRSRSTPEHGRDETNRDSKSGLLIIDIFGFHRPYVSASDRFFIPLPPVVRYPGFPSYIRQFALPEMLRGRGACGVHLKGAERVRAR